MDRVSVHRAQMPSVIDGRWGAATQVRATWRGGSTTAGDAGERKAVVSSDEKKVYIAYTPRQQGKGP